MKLQTKRLKTLPLPSHRKKTVIEKNISSIDDTAIKSDTTKRNEVISIIKKKTEQKATAESNTEREEHGIASNQH